MPDAEAVHVYLNGESFGGSMFFKQITVYTMCGVGEMSVSIVVGGVTKATANITLLEHNYFTLVTAGSLANLTLSFSVDDLRVPKKDRTALRVFNFAPNAPSVSFSINLGPTLIPDAVFAQSSPYVQVRNNTYDFVVDPAVAHLPALLVQNTFLLPASVYTVFVLGIFGGVGKSGASALVMQD